MPDTIGPSVGSVRNVGNMQFRWDGIRWIPTHFEGGGIGLWVNVNAPDDPVAYPLWFNPGTGGTGPAPTWDSGAAWDTQGLSWDTHGGGGVLSVWDGSAWQPVGGTQGPPGPPGEGGMTLDQAMETFLALSGGNMAGPINMQGLTITNLAPVPSATSNSAAPAAWVMQEIAATTLYQGVWQASLNIPDLSRVATHQNGFSWIAITPDPQQSIHTTATGIAGIPQGTEIFYGDHIVWSSHDSRFDIIHSSNLSLTEAEEFFVLRDGDTMEGPLYLVQPPDNPPGSLAARVDWVRDRIAEIDTGGTGPGITIPLPISQGGTEATNAEQARANLGITDTGNVVTGVSSVGVTAPLTASTNPITSVGTISLGTVPLNLGGTGVVAADNAQLLQLLGAATTDDLADYLRIDGTVPMQGPLNMNEEPIVHLALIPEEVDWAATRYWVDQEIAAIGLYQGTWQATLNIPDLRDVETHHNGFSWIILTPDPNQPAVVSVAGIAGVSQGTQVFYGEHIIWSEVNQRFDIIHAGNLSVTAAEQLFLSLTGGVMKGPINMGGPDDPHQLTGLRAPPAGAPDSDAATLGWVRSNYIARAGNSTAPMTGPLLLVGNAAVPTQAVPLQQLNSVKDDLLEAIEEIIGAGGEGGVTLLTPGIGIELRVGSNPANITSVGSIGLAPVGGGFAGGQYQGLTIDQFGRVTGATNQNYLTGPLTSAQVTTALGFTPLASPLTSAMVTGALGFTPLQGPLTSAMVTGALGFTPLQGPLTSAMVTGALGFTPISTVTSAMITDALGFTPLQGPLTSAMVTGALGFTPISGNQNITLTGGVTGSGAITTSIATTVTQLRNTAISTAVPNPGDVLTLVDGQWTPQAPAPGGGLTLPLTVPQGGTGATTFAVTNPVIAYTGHSPLIAGDGTNPLWAVTGPQGYVGTYGATAAIVRFGTGAFDPYLEFIRGRGSLSAPTAPGIGDSLGGLKFGSWIGSSPLAYRYGAQIFAYPTENHSTSQLGTGLTLQVTAPGGFTEVRALNVEVPTTTLAVPQADYDNPLLVLRAQTHPAIRFAPFQPVQPFDPNNHADSWQVYGSSRWYGVEAIHPATPDAQLAWFGFNNAQPSPWAGLAGGIGNYGDHTGYSLNFEVRGKLQVTQADNSVDFGGRILELTTAGDRWNMVWQGVADRWGWFYGIKADGSFSINEGYPGWAEWLRIEPSTGTARAGIVTLGGPLNMWNRIDCGDLWSHMNTPNTGNVLADGWIHGIQSLGTDGNINASGSIHAQSGISFGIAPDSTTQLRWAPGVYSTLEAVVNAPIQGIWNADRVIITGWEEVTQQSQYWPCTHFGVWTQPPGPWELNGRFVAWWGRDQWFFAFPISNPWTPSAWSLADDALAVVNSVPELREDMVRSVMPSAVIPAHDEIPEHMWEPPLIATLWKAVQQLSARVDELERMR